jgi:hypothetical protein
MIEDSDIPHNVKNVESFPLRRVSDILVDVYPSESPSLLMKQRSIFHMLVVV